MENENNIKSMKIRTSDKLSKYATILACLIGFGSFLVGLYNSNMTLSEQGYYGVLLVYSVFSSISLQKTVTEIDLGISVSKFYQNICIFSIILALLLFIIGLFNADLLKSEKGFYLMSYILTMFTSLYIQKQLSGKEDKKGEI